MFTIPGRSVLPVSSANAAVWEQMWTNSSKALAYPFEKGWERQDCRSRSLRQQAEERCHLSKNGENISKMFGVKEALPSLGGLEPPTFRLTAERANRLRHRDT